MEALIFGLGLCVVVWVFANQRGRSGFGWFCLSLVISPIVTGLLILVLPNRAHAVTYAVPHAARDYRRIEPRLDR